MKKRMLSVLVLLVSAGMLLGEAKKNPDENTLWIEDGVNIVVSPQTGKGWVGSPDGGTQRMIKIIPAEEKGFYIIANDASGSKTHHYIPRNPEYKFMVLDLDNIEQYKGYNNWTLQVQDAGITWSYAGALPTGIFVFPLYGRKASKDTKGDSMWIYAYNVKLHYNYIKIVKQPECMVEVISPEADANPDKSFTVGNKLTFKVTLKEEAEDVSIQLYSSGVPQPMKIFDNNKIQLKPVDEKQLVWQADVVVKNVPIAEKDYKKPDRVMMKVTLLGGAIDRPVWSPIQYGFYK